jgi:hypothetical protein
MYIVSIVRLTAPSLLPSIPSAMTSQVIRDIANYLSDNLDYVMPAHENDADIRKVMVLDLPVDVLAMIFELCVPDTRFSQVCTSWRSLAVNSPFLWTSIDFLRSSSWTVSGIERMRRAQDSLLDVEFSEQLMLCQRIPLGPCIDAYLLKSSNVRTLKLRCYNVSTAECIVRNHCPTPPGLEEMQILVGFLEEEQFEFENSAAESDNRYMLELGSDLFGGGAPRLRKLTLHQVYIDPSWPPYAHLHTFQILCSDVGDCRMGAQKILALLEAMPLLEIFHGAYLVDQGDLNTTVTAKIKLSCLRQFELDDPVPCVTVLLQHLCFPSDTVLTVECAHIPQEPEAADVHDLLRALSPHLAANRDRFLRSTVAFEYDHIGSRFRAADLSDSPPWIEFYFKIDVCRLPTIFQAHLPLDEVKALRVPSWRDIWTAPYPFSRDMWSAILAGMPQVQNILLQDIHAPVLCEVLTISSQQQQQQLCPLLRQLGLTEGYDLSSISDSGRTLLDLLANTINARRELGIPVEAIQLDNTTLEDARVVCIELSTRGVSLEIVGDEGEEVDSDGSDGRVHKGEGEESGNEEGEEEELSVEEMTLDWWGYIARRQLLQVRK